MKYLIVIISSILLGCIGNNSSKQENLSNCLRCELCESLKDSLLNQGFSIISSITNSHNTYALSSDTTQKIGYNFSIFFMSKANEDSYAFVCTEFFSHEDLMKFISDNEIRATGVKPRLKTIRNSCEYEFSVTKESLTDELLQYRWLFDHVEEY